jgi:hypothetical protein
MDSNRGNQSQSSGNRSRTGVSDEAYDLMVTLTNKLQELWRLDEFIGDGNRQGDRGLWERMRDHDREDVDALLTALKRALG